MCAVTRDSCHSAGSDLVDRSGAEESTPTGPGLPGSWDTLGPAGPQGPVLLKYSGNMAAALAALQT